MKKKIIRLTESDIHRIVKESVNKILRESYSDSITYGNKYEVGFTFFITLGENRMEYKQSISRKDKLLDLLDTMSEIVDYDVEKDDEDWCINCIANVTAENIEQVNNKIEELLSNTNCTWDYHYIKGLDTNEYWQP